MRGEDIHEQQEKLKMSAQALAELEPFVPPAERGQPPWPIALLFPCQGEWTEDEYLALDTPRLIEFSSTRCLEVLPIRPPIIN